MGMAASQARLLTITARLADNELRSQTINNAKMRLATQSAQASENYVNALNASCLMFNNTDIAGNTSSQLLTYNALSAYSPYNTQYGLINSAGLLLVSEADARNFQNANGSLEKFLKNYGIEYESTYFSNPLMIEYLNKDYTEIKKAMALITDSTDDMISTLEDAYGAYDAIGASVEYIDYLEYSSAYNSLEKSYKSQVTAAWKEFLGCDNFNYSAINNLGDLQEAFTSTGLGSKDSTHTYDINSKYYSKPYNINYLLAKGFISDSIANDIRNSISKNDWITQSKTPTSTTETSKTYNIDGITVVYNTESSSFTVNGNTYTKDTEYTPEDSSYKYIFSSVNENGNLSYKQKYTSTNYPDEARMYMQVIVNSLLSDSSAFDKFAATVRSQKGSLIDDYNNSKKNMKDFISSKKDITTLSYTSNGSTVEFNSHYITDMAYVINFATNYNAEHTDNKIEFTDKYQNMIKMYMVNAMISEFGEPKYAWVDTTDTTDTGNSSAKAQWYTNLFNRMCKGYKTLEDGLASSPQWLQYAFESGLVSMEQVDKSYNWNSIDYKTCSKITEEADNSAAVAKAEAEYNRAMNDIKTKDNMYDLQLKNIDTEHTALQEEYNVIKQVINKNIDRTMKFDQSS